MDFRDNLEPVKSLDGTYATYAYVNVSKRNFFSLNPGIWVERSLVHCYRVGCLLFNILGSISADPSGAAFLLSRR